MLRKTFLVLFIALTYSFSGKSSHIVGGEINLIHITEDSFRLSLHVYYDKVNSVLDVIDNQVEIYAFSEATSQVVETFVLPKTLDRELPYTSIRCRLGNFITREIIYSKIIKLDTTKYTQASGYYMAWERCCRNGVIDNIENSGEMGIAVTLDFPSLLQNGKFTPNSSPIFSSLTGDYACLNQWYFVDFEATDADGDELRFSLVNPLRGHATFLNNAPNPESKPYNNPPITWKSLQGYSVNTQVRGAPSLELQPSGRLRVKPVERGLFVFAVKCEEFRKGKKIGQKVREFQILVQECTTTERHFPQANAFSTISSTIPISSSDTIIFEMDKIDKRIYLKVTDEDADSVRLRALPVQTKTGQFPQGAILTDTLGLLPNNTDSHVFSVSYPHCPEKSGGVYADRFVISDLTCGQPYEDTVTVFVRVKEKIHQPPFVSVVSDSTNSINEFVFEGIQNDTIAIPVGWKDDDRDSLIYVNFSHFRDSLPQNPFTDSVRTYPAIAHDTLFWEVPCDLFKGVADSTLSFHFPIIVTDFVRCGFEKKDTVKVQIFIRNRHKFNTKPRIVRQSRLPISDTLAIYADTAYLTKPYKFRLDLEDTEGDSIFIKWKTENFAAKDFAFPIDSLKKDSSVVLLIDWLPRCWFLDIDSMYKSLKTNIIIQDYSVCDTLIFSDTVRLDLVLTSNNQKSNTWANLPDKRYDFSLKDSIYSDSIRVNVPYQLSIKSFDYEGDSVEIRFKSDLDTNKHKVKFYRNEKDTIKTNEYFFEWKPNCDYFFDPDSTYPIPIEFIATDLDTCLRRKSDTLRTILYILPDRERSFEPYFFTDLDSIVSQFYVDTATVGSLHSLKIGATGLGNLVMKNTILSTDFKTITPKFTSIVSLDSIQTDWTWKLDCAYFSDFDSLPKYLDLQFEIDVNSCNENLKDTAKIRLFLRYPEHQRSNLQIIQSEDTIKHWKTEILAGHSLSFLGFANKVQSTTLLKIKPDFDILKNPIQTKIIRKDSVLQTHFLLQTECSNNLKNLQLQLTLEDTSACNFSIDTASVFIKVLPTPSENQAPILTFNSDLNFDVTEKIYTDSIFIGEKFTLQINGKDLDGDSLFLTPVAQNFDFEEIGAEFLSVSGKTNFSTVFSWQTSCKNLNIRGKDFESRTFEFDLFLRDKKYCLPEKSQMARVRWIVLGRPELNQPPKITVNLPKNSDGIYTTEITEGENLAFQVQVQDIDEDMVILRGKPENFPFSDINISFSETQKTAPYFVDFKGKTNCEIIENQEEILQLTFQATDLPTCGNPLSDEIKIQIRVVPEAPKKFSWQLDLPQNSEGIFETNLTENKPFETEILLKSDSENTSQKSVIWTIQGNDFSVEDMGIIFAPTSDSTANLSWTPPCNLANENTDFQIFITARTPPTECLSEVENTLRIQLNLDIPQTDFQHPTNILTPNGDGKNDIFQLPNVLDNCERQIIDFQKIEIFNRWGNRVFESTNPKFEWSPNNMPAGVYFYALKVVNQKVIQGIITIIK